MPDALQQIKVLLLYCSMPSVSNGLEVALIFICGCEAKPVSSVRITNEDDNNDFLDGDTVNYREVDQRSSSTTTSDCAGRMSVGGIGGGAVGGGKSSGGSGNTDARGGPGGTAANDAGCGAKGGKGGKAIVQDNDATSRGGKGGDAITAFSELMVFQGLTLLKNKLKLDLDDQ